MTGPNFTSPLQSKMVGEGVAWGNQHRMLFPFSTSNIEDLAKPQQGNLSSRMGSLEILKKSISIASYIFFNEILSGQLTPDHHFLKG